MNFDSPFWKRRAEKYDSLEWVNRQGYTETFVRLGQFGKGDRVLDVGTGTGIIAYTIAPFVDHVTGIDQSDEMLAHAREKNTIKNVTFESGDVRQLKYTDAAFHRVTARMVYHHILEGAEVGIKECHRVLKPGGMFLLSEGVPPIPEIRDWYSTMFAYKEERRTFLDEDLVALARSAPFREVLHDVYISRRMSIKNWLNNGAVSEENKAIILKMHHDLDPAGKRAYNMDITDDDIFIDMKFVIISATK